MQKNINKNIKSTIIQIILSLTLLHTTAWGMEPPKPEKCPSISALQQLKFDNVRENVSAWVMMIKSNYDTQDNWVFSTDYNKYGTPTKEEALAKANNDLSVLTFIGGPMYLDDQKVWTCLYTTNVKTGEHEFLATTPPPFYAAK